MIENCDKIFRERAEAKAATEAKAAAEAAKIAAAAAEAAANLAAAERAASRPKGKKGAKGNKGNKGRKVLKGTGARLDGDEHASKPTTPSGKRAVAFGKATKKPKAKKKGALF